MDTTNPTFSELKAQAPATRGADCSDQAASSIHYAGAKDPKIPMPYVVAGIVVLALGGGTADHCVVTSNAGGDWSIAENARLVRIGC